MDTLDVEKAPDEKVQVVIDEFKGTLDAAERELTWTKNSMNKDENQPAKADAKKTRGKKAKQTKNNE